MPQFYLPLEARTGENFYLKGPEAFHISKVLRCRSGESLEFFDGQGGRYKANIISIRKDGSVEGRITETIIASHPQSKVRLNLYQALVKGNRWEWLLEKATEMGISCIVPVMTQHTVVLLKEDARVSSKLDHWRKIILAAAKQCGRSDLPVIRPPLALRDALAEAQKSGLVLFAWEKMAGAFAPKTSSPREQLSGQPSSEHVSEGARETIQKAISKLPSSAQQAVTVNLFIGPEGGFSEEEVELAEMHNAFFFSLGPRVLRGETAAIAASTLVLYELGAL